MNSKTLEANSIPIPPHLAGLLKQALGRTGTGFDEGAFLQQLHYWTLNLATEGWIVDGVKWIYNSLKRVGFRICSGESNKSCPRATVLLMCERNRFLLCQFLH